MKIVSICPSNTELVEYLGLTSSLVGVDDYSDWPESIKDLPKLGPDLSINMDKVEELKPDLVLASLTVPGMERNIEELKRRNIPYIIIPNPTTMSEIVEGLLYLGEATNRIHRAELTSDRFNHIIDDYIERRKQVRVEKTIYWEWWAKPVFTPGAENWLTEMSHLAGGKNIFEDKKEKSVKTDWDEVRKRNPDVISIVWVGVQHSRVDPKQILRRPQWNQMKAIKNKQLYILEEPYFCRPSPRLLIGLRKIANLLHPDIYPCYRADEDPLLDTRML
ncbi:cobalamin-binding protein [Evansella tamaricis]|uniref:Cobalamin-binding protein n=1 Tax=Evansella tamaricis TaxID=2069301 RepID=A0ABS6JKQ6_9BACI|nr:cobalamin-binding protein [Evansella tamaricis]MBU9713407.1 cobalamin-binding protein [Evansella tamaricis]